MSKEGSRRKECVGASVDGRVDKQNSKDAEAPIPDLVVYGGYALSPFRSGKGILN